MQNKNNPLSPHLQIYEWNITSLLSITHRIVGVINFIIIFVLCIFIISLNIENLSETIFSAVFESSFSKFIVISICWSFSFQVLNEIRHLFWDIGFGYDLKISKISGYLVVIGSFILSVAFYLLGKGTLS
tara:strand:+ start:296 stop:685 length:390 start_codon:yes stop_codon:yes gene_type:complete